MTIPSHPLQSPEWASFREETGNTVLKTDYGYITIHTVPLIGKIGIFLKCPEPTAKMLTYLKNIGQEEGLLFIKLEPNTKNNKSDISLLKKYGAVRGKTFFTPTTFVINLLLSEEEILKSFSSKTRYNIRLAQKHGVVVKEDNSAKAFDTYISLMRETVQRQGFYAHSEKYHRLMWKFMHESKIAHLLTATYKKSVLATWILFSYKDTLYYPYGASSEKHKQVMASSLMMWEAIKLGKKLGLKKFDLWGREEGKGFTRFKEGFSPEIVEFLGTWDLIIDQPKYNIYRLAEVVRWIILRSKSRFVKPTF